MKNFLIIYHSSDFDGIASCLICRKYLINSGIDESSIDCLGWTYGDKAPSVDKILKKYQTVFMVDLSFKVPEMLKLASSGNFIWIDHHHTAIEDSIKSGYDNLTGLRRIGTAACELTWEYFFPNYECPLFIQYLGAWDVFDRNRFDWEKIVIPIQSACSAYYNLNPKNWYEDLDKLLLNTDNILEQLIRDGQLIYGYTRKRSEAAVNKYGFEVLVDGRLKGICLLNTTFSSLQFQSVANKYDCFIVVNRRAPDYYNFSIYLEPDNNLNFNAGEYLKEHYSGGGHAGAAGGFMNFEGFKRLLIDQKL